MASNRRKNQTRSVLLDRASEVLPIFRLSDSSDDTVVAATADGGGRWRVLPAPDERLPGTFDQDVYFEILRRLQEADHPGDGAVSFTLHAFLRSMGRRVDGRTYEQLRGALVRLEKTVVESEGAWHDASLDKLTSVRFTLLTSVAIDRRRSTDRDQLVLFAALASNEPGDARVVVSPQIRSNIALGYTSEIVTASYLALSSPVARRLYRLLQAIRTERSWAPTLERLAELLPLTQRYPSHLQRVLQPAHEMLTAAGIVKRARFYQEGRVWRVEYTL